MATLPLFPELVKLGAAWGLALCAVAARLHVSADELAATIWLESRGNPQARSPSGSRVGLIQWNATTAAAVGTSLEQLQVLSAQEQLVFVERFLKPDAPRCSRPGDVRLAVFYPAALGSADATPLSAAAWASNKPLDLDKDGTLTAGEVRAQCLNALRNRARWTLPETAPSTPSGDLLLPVLVAVVALALWGLR